MGICMDEEDRGSVLVVCTRYLAEKKSFVSAGNSLKQSNVEGPSAPKQTRDEPIQIHSSAQLNVF